MTNEERESLNDNLIHHQLSDAEIERYFRYNLNIQKIKGEDQEHEFALISAQIFGKSLSEVKSLLQEIKANDKPISRPLTAEEQKSYRDYVNLVKTNQTARIIEENFNSKVTAKRTKNFEILVEFEAPAKADEIIYAIEILEIYFPISKFEITVHKKGDAFTVYKQLIRE